MCWVAWEGRSEGTSEEGSDWREVKVPGKIMKPARRIPRGC